MKIKFIVSKLNLVRGGGSNLCLDLKARAFQERGHKVAVVTLFSKENQIKGCLSYQLIEKDLKGYNLFLNQKRISEIMKNLSFDTDIFYLEGPNFLWAGGLYRKLGGKVPVVANLNNYSLLAEEIYKKPPLYQKKKSFLEKAKHIFRTVLEKTIGFHLINAIDLFFATPSVAKLYQKAGFPKEKFAIFPDFIDVKSLKKIKKGKNPFGKLPNVFQIFYAGRLDFDKGVDILINSFSKLENREICHLHIIGEGPEKENLKTLVKNLNLTKLVTFYPWLERKDLFNFFFNSDLFILPSRWPEPFGLTIIEAMIFGLPVVVPKTGAPKWVVGSAGLTFRNGDIEDLKRKIHLLIKNKKLRAKLAKDAKIRADKFDWRNYIVRIENILSNLAFKNKI